MYGTLETECGLCILCKAESYCTSRPPVIQARTANELLQVAETRRRECELQASGARDLIAALQAAASERCAAGERAVEEASEAGEAAWEKMAGLLQQVP